MTLNGKTILVTRPREQADSLKALLEKEGANVLFFPTVEILPLVDWSELDDCFAQENNFDWILFSSQNGVRFFLERLHHFETGQTQRMVQQGLNRATLQKGPIKIAAVGTTTAKVLREHNLPVELVPLEADAEGMVTALAEEASKGKRFLSIRGSRGRNVITQELTQLGGIVREIAVYRSVDRTETDPEIVSLLEKGKIDAITVTSSAIAKSLAFLLGEHLAKTKVVSISPLTSTAFRKTGNLVAADAPDPSMKGIVTGLIELFR